MSIKISKWKGYFEKKYGVNFLFMTYRFSFKSLYRGRCFQSSDYTLSSVKNEIQTTKDILAPPKKWCKTQRCNIKGQPILYLSSHISSIPKELECKHGDFLVIAKFKQNKSLYPMAILGWEKLMRVESLSLREIIKDHFSDKSIKVKEIDNKISNIFIQTTENATNKIYIITNAISQLFFRHNIGIVYPSVDTPDHSFNLALKPNKVKTVFSINTVNIYKCISYNEHETKLQKVAIGRIDSKNGYVKWTHQNISDIQVFQKK